MRPIFEVSDADIIFPTADNIPKKEEIPEEFWRGETKWNRCFSDWFYSGIKSDQLIPKKGIDKTKALRAIDSIIGSWGPKHEHKEAAVAYLLSEWFSDYKIEREQQTKELK